MIRIARICLFTALLVFAGWSPLRSQTKYALIVGIGQYKNWPEISSSNDIPFIDSALLKQGFSADHITILRDNLATMDGLNNAFRQLVASVKTGDIVVIHISSHGEQVEDDNHDEADGLDETIVSYDALMPNSTEKYEIIQSKYFRDDLFGDYMNQLRLKLGPKGDILVTIDACHSGSGTRGTRKVRGGQPALVSKTFVKPGNGNRTAAGVFEEASPQNESKMATYVVISAARAEELNSETDVDGRPMGSLSYAISKCFQSLAPGTTYRSLFSSILSVMNDIVPQQKPVIEGNGLDRILLGGHFVEQKAFVEIERIRENQLILKGGKMMGLDTGAKVAVYAAGTLDPAKGKLLASGRITKSTGYAATAILDKSPGLTFPTDGWVFVTEPAYNIKPLVIKTVTDNRRGAGLVFSAAEQQEISNVLRGIPLVRVDGDPELLLAKGSGMDTLKIASNGFVFAVVDHRDSYALQESINRYVRFKFLENLQISDPSRQVDLRLVPWIHGNADTANIGKKIVNGIYEYAVGDTMVIWARNRSDETVYLNILDLQPDGMVNPIFPNTRNNIYPDNLVIGAGQERLFGNYKIRIGPPAGMETFKIFISDKEINLESVAQDDGRMSRGNLTVLEKLVKESRNVATRGGESQNISNADGAVFNVLFRIKTPSR